MSLSYFSNFADNMRRVEDSDSDWYISRVMLEQGWRTSGTRAQNGTRKDFLASRHSQLSQFISYARPASKYSEEYVYVYIYIYMCVCVAWVAQSV